MSQNFYLKFIMEENKQSKSASELCPFCNELEAKISMVCSSNKCCRKCIIKHKTTCTLCDKQKNSQSNETIEHTKIMEQKKMQSDVNDKDEDSGSYLDEESNEDGIQGKVKEESQKQKNQQKKQQNPQAFALNILQFESQIKSNKNEGNYEEIDQNSNKSSSNLKQKEGQWQQKYLQMKQEYEKKLQKKTLQFQELKQQYQTKNYQQVQQFKKLQKRNELLRQRNMALESRINLLENRQNQSMNQKCVLDEKVLQLQRQMEKYKKTQQAQRQQRQKLIKRIINGYQKMLVNHFEEINNNFSYGLILEKINMIKSLINNFQTVLEDKSPQIEAIILANKPLITTYITNDLKKYRQEIQKMEITFELFSTNRIKIVLQKLKLYKEIGENLDTLQECQNAIGNKINEFLKTVVCKQINNNKTAKNWFVIIGYLNKFLHFQATFKNEIQVVYEKCSANLNQIHNNLIQNFKKIQNMYFSLRLNDPQNVKKMHFNKENIEILVKLTTSIKIIQKNQKYMIEFQKYTKKKINQFKDDINKKLSLIRNNIHKQIENKDIISNYDNNYRYLQCLSKMKDFDYIWENEQNYFYSFKFTQLYQNVSKRNEGLKKVREHEINQMIGQEKVIFEKLESEIDIIIKNQQMLRVLTCRIKEIFTKKLFKLQKMNEFSLINQEDLQKFKQFYLQIKQFYKIINGKKELENNFDQEKYKQIVESKLRIIFRYLEQRYIYFFNNYNSPSFDQIEKEIKYTITFQQFLKVNFSVQHKQLKIKLENTYDPPQKKDCIFKSLQEIIQQGKQFIQNFIKASQVKNQDYDKIKKFRKSFSPIQEETIDVKVSLDIDKRIIQLQKDYWLKGQIQMTPMQSLVRQNIGKLSPQLHKSLHEKLEKARNQIVQQIKKKEQEIHNKLKQQGSNYIKEVLIPLILSQKYKKTFYQAKFQKILEDYLTGIQEKQFKQVSKRQQFIEQYIHKVKDVLHNLPNLQQIYQKLQYNTYRIQQNMPFLIKSICTEFQKQPFISKKTQQDIEQINLLANLRFFQQQQISKSLMNLKNKESLNIFLGQTCLEMKKILANFSNKFSFKQINKTFDHQEILSQLIKIKIICNFSNKISYVTVQSKSSSVEVNQRFNGLKVQIIKAQFKIKQFHEIIKKAVQEIHNYSFTQSLNREKITDGQILNDLSKKDVKLINLINIEQYFQKYQDLIRNPVVQLNIFEIKHKELLKNLELSWRKFYQMSIREEMNIVFKINKKISNKFQMFIKVKNIVKQNRIKIFEFIGNQEYQIKKSLIQQSKKIFQKTQKDIKQINNQYMRYEYEIKGKIEEKKVKRALAINQIKQSYKAKEEQIINMQDIIIIDDYGNEVIKTKKDKQRDLANAKKSCSSQVQEIQSNYSKTINDLQEFSQGNIKNLFIKITDNIRVIEKISLDFAQEGIKEQMQIIIKEIFKQIQKLHSVPKEQFLQQFYEKKVTCHLVANIVQVIDLFTEHKQQQFNESVKHQDIHYVIKNCPQINCKIQSQKQKILNDFQMYKNQFQNTQKSYKQRRTQENLSSIIKSIKTQALTLSAPVLLGRIFGIESILRIKHKQVLRFIRNPHPSQIVTILLLIEPKSKQGTFQILNGMAQVKTGEGKSVVLAGLCCFLALKGYYTYCACYSSYLSIRDEKQYHSLFEALQILDRVVYGTFADHCKGILDEKDKIYFKNVISQCLLNNSQSTNSKYQPYLKRLQSIFQGTSSVKRVLIIDEVDVFFQERFFGQFYRPAISLQNQRIKNLIEFIWKNKHLGKSIKQKQQLKSLIKNQIFYKNLINNWSHLSSFFQNQLQGMINAAVDPTHSYQIVNRKIVYRYNGIIEQSLNNGYKTVFSACQQMQKKTISQQYYDKTLRLSVIISQFSYAELPKYFTNILGVSGTLQTLSKSRKDMMREKYNIQNFYILPSIYGEPRRKILDPLVISQNNYDTILIEKIKECSNTDDGRPVLVFFRNKNDMIQFCQSEKVKANISDCVFLSEDQEDHMRDSIIRLAGRKGRVTFMTSYYSRGTDFILENKKIIDAGGFHVIQTYISKNQSDYVQVYGRTARQGKNGTFQMVVKREFFSDYNISIFISTKIMEDIKKVWSQNDKKQGLKLKQKIENAKQIHLKSFSIIKSLPQGTLPLIKGIQKLNYIKQVALKNIRSVIAIDGTGSMSGVLLKIKEVLQTAICQTQKIIEQKNVNASFEQQIMIYRNYSSKSIIFERSGFMSDSKDLTNWIGNIKTSGGQGNEAIQIIYNKINAMEDVSQLIIIGDARCNTCEQMLSKRNKINSDPQYWKNINVPFIQSPEEQLNKLILKNVPIHSLYITTSQAVKDYFNDISTKTKGVCKQFRINDENAGQVLADFIAESVLNRIGGQELVNLYRMRFG